MKIEEITQVYSEERDCAASTKLPEHNEIKFSSVHNGMGSYIVIETKRWALDEKSLVELVNVCQDMMRRVNKDQNEGRM